MRDADLTQRTLQQLVDGDPIAFKKSFEVYWPRIVGLAEKRMPNWLKRFVGPDDIAQSVFCSFARHSKERKYSFENGRALWSLLALIAVRKIIKRTERESPAGSLPEDSVLSRVFDAEQRSQDAVVLIDLVHEFLKKLDSNDRKIVELRLQGHTLTEIAARAGCSRATVTNKLRWSKAVLRRMLDND